MEVVVVGLNHKSAPIQLRERLSIPSAKTGEFLRAMAERRLFEERLLLSTCNRTEIYGVANGDRREAVEHAKRFLGEFTCTRPDDFEGSLYTLRQPDSVEHLFSVAAGLDSLVIGETEITGQVKDAYFEAQTGRQTGKVLNHLFQRSFKVAKELRTQTQIGAGRVSVASVAVDLAEKIFDRLQGIRVLVLGTGQMAEQVVKAMTSRGAVPLIVSRTSGGRAESLALECGALSVPYERYEEETRLVDVVITSTLSDRPVVSCRQVKNWMRARHERPLFLIDIAVPRNVEADTEKLDNVYLYNLDDLQKIADDNLRSRRGQIDECRRIIHAQTQHFLGWLAKEFGA